MGKARTLAGTSWRVNSMGAWKGGTSGGGPIAAAVAVAERPRRLRGSQDGGETTPVQTLHGSNCNPLTTGFGYNGLAHRHERRTSPTATREQGFVRGLNLFDATMVVIGAMIGSGIFIVSADMSRLIGSPGWMLVAWAVTGVLTITAALSYGELASMLPDAAACMCICVKRSRRCGGSCTAGRCSP